MSHQALSLCLHLHSQDTCIEIEWGGGGTTRVISDPERGRAFTISLFLDQSFFLLFFGRHSPRDLRTVTESYLQRHIDRERGGFNLPRESKGDGDKDWAHKVQVEGRDKKRLSPRVVEFYCPHVQKEANYRVWSQQCKVCYISNQAENDEHQVHILCVLLQMWACRTVRSAICVARSCFPNWG